MSGLFEEVTQEQEEAIASNTRQRGVAGGILRNFLETGMASARLRVGDGTPYAGRKAGSVKTALDNARKHADQADIKDKVSVVVVGDKDATGDDAQVFLRSLS